MLIIAFGSLLWSIEQSDKDNYDCVDYILKMIGSMVMANVNKTGDENTANFDAEQLVEEIAAGDEKAPEVNVEADYERSKQFDVAEIDRTGQGAKAAEKVTTSPSPKSSSTSTASGEQPETGDPDAFRKMAKDVNKSLDT